MDAKNLNFLTVEQVCSILGYKKSYLYKLTHERRIPYFKMRGGKILFDAAELEIWIRAGRVSTRAELAAKADAILNEASK